MIDEKLAIIVCEVLDLGNDEISENLSRESVENWDSLNHLRLVTAVEEAYRISMTMDEINSISGFADIQLMIERHAN